MKKALSYALKISLTLFLLFLILGTVHDMLYQYTSGDIKPIWEYQGRSEREFYWDSVLTLITALPVLMSIWAKFNYRYRLMLAVPFFLYLIYLNLTVPPID